MLILSQGFTVSHDLPVSTCTKILEGAWPGWLTGIFHIIEYHAQYKSQGNCPGANDHRDGLDISQCDEQLYCASLVFHGCYSSLFPFHYVFIIITITNIKTSIILFPVLHCSYLKL